MEKWHNTYNMQKRYKKIYIYKYNSSYLIKLFCARVEKVVRLKQGIQE